jgi:hypothetical protein
MALEKFGDCSAYKILANDSDLLIREKTKTQKP